MLPAGLLVLLAALPIGASAQGGTPQDLVRKQVAAPPEDIVHGIVHLPDRALHAESTGASLLSVSESGGLHQTHVWVPPGVAYLVPIFMDRPTERLLFRIDAGPWTTWRRLQTAGIASLEEAEVHDNWTLMAPRRMSLRLDRGGLLQIADLLGSRDPGATIMAGDQDPAMLRHGLSSYASVLGEDLALLAWIDPEFSAADVVEAEVRLQAGGVERTAFLLDDGRDLDKVRGDGVFSLRVPGDLIGKVDAWTRVTARNEQGDLFTRVGLQSFEIFPSSIGWGRGAASAKRTGDVLQIGLPTDVALPRDSIHFSAEVWATDAQGAWQPACWLARMQPLTGEPGRVGLPLELDLAWLSRSGLRAPLELRNVRVQDPNGWAVLARRDRWDLPADALGELPLPPSGSASSNLLFRIAGASLAPSGGTSMVSPSSITSVPSGGFGQPGQGQTLRSGLMLVHGWCSGGVTWPVSQFTGPPIVFSDPNQNRTYDEFAQLIAAAGAHKRSFGVVAHSQGGNASLHLLTYYQSGLDRASGGRRIQSLASPYQGTPLASLGFFLCGVNNDLTTSGAAAWLANIPMGVRAEVDYYTTSNAGFFDCQFATGLLLSNPEDGVVERSRGLLVGGNNMGHVTGWCHTTGMSEPAGYNDAGRNAVMGVLTLLAPRFCNGDSRAALLSGGPSALGRSRLPAWASHRMAAGQHGLAGGFCGLCLSGHPTQCSHAARTVEPEHPGRAGGFPGRAPAALGPSLAGFDLLLATGQGPGPRGRTGFADVRGTLEPNNQALGPRHTHPRPDHATLCPQGLSGVVPRGPCESWTSSTRPVSPSVFPSPGAKNYS